MIYNKRSQIWVETAIYTLIGLTIIAILLAIANPQIDKIKDKGIISQATQALNDLDSKVLDVEQSVGSIAVPNIKVGGGKFLINSSNNSISYILDNTGFELTQVGSEVRQGSLIVRTEKYGNRFNIFITRYYSGLNITYQGNKTERFLEASPIPYRIKIENKGNSNIDFSII